MCCSIWRVRLCDGASVSTPTQKKKVRDAITLFTAQAQHYEAHWHYSQQRPYMIVTNPALDRIVGDCSAYVANVFRHAMREAVIPLADPLGYHYDGWGNTWTEETWLRAHGKRVSEANGFLVGDIAVYRGHTTVCRLKGSASVSKWSSFGSETGPKQEPLHYRDDLIGVWRHPGLL